MNITKRPSFQPVTLAEPKPDTDPLARPIPYVITPQLLDTAVMCRLEIEAMRRFRAPEGLEVGEATQAEWDSALAKFRVTL